MSERIKAIHVSPEDYPIDDCECITYVCCEDPSAGGDAADIIIYAGSDCTLVHNYLFALAQEQGLISEKATPCGGGHINLEDSRKSRDSHAFGPVSDENYDAFLDLLDEVL